jgi:lipopolysaccharide transport system ATP-binding protein
MSTVIKVENLSKRYRLGVINRDMLYKDLQSRWAKLLGKEDPNTPILASHDKRLEHEDEFWALRNIDLEVREGEVLGIIGKNGAGKSTLLKILSQITAPTEGKIKIKGRIASLLEVGTGFHSELTGRENVFLNGAILGMTRKEVRSKFDEIVAFADIHEFIDTPVKRYSSGMYVRLAFAVAAHLEPEILVIDEVLSVGDAEFQKRCIGKIQNVSLQGRTVLFVSHIMASVRALCTKAVLLDQGRIFAQGPTASIVDNYLTQGSPSTPRGWYSVEKIDGKEFQTLSARALDCEGHARHEFTCDEAIILELLVSVSTGIRGLYGYISIRRQDGVVVLEGDSKDGGTNILDGLPPGEHCIRVAIPQRLLAPSSYSLYVSFASSQSSRGFCVDAPGEVVSFTVHDPNTMRGNNRGGFFSTILDWKVSKVPGSSEWKTA